MIKSTTQMIGSGVNRAVKSQKKHKPIVGIFPGSITSFGKTLGEYKIVKKMERGFFGLYPVYEKKFVQYEESDFIDNKVFLGGGGSGVLVPTPLPEPYAVPPIENLYNPEGNREYTISLSWDAYEDDEINPTQRYIIYVNEVFYSELAYVAPGEYFNNNFTVKQLEPATEYKICVEVEVLHNGLPKTSVVSCIVASTLTPIDPVEPIDPNNPIPEAVANL